MAIQIMMGYQMDGKWLMASILLMVEMLMATLMGMA
jgi:hypothetical protein